MGKALDGSLRQRLYRVKAELSEALRVAGPYCPRLATFRFLTRCPPAATQVLALGELVRSALIRVSDRAPVFVGKDARGDPLSGNRHAFVLPLCDRGGDARIRTVAVWCREGFNEDEQEFLRTLSWIHRTDGSGPRAESG